MPPRMLRLAVLLATLLLLGTVAGGALLLIDRLRGTALEATRETVERLVRVTESAVNREFLQVDAALAGVPAVLGTLSGSLDQTRANRVLRELDFQNLAFRDLLLLTPEGEVWAAALPASRNRAPPLDPGLLDAARHSPTVVVGGPTRNPLTGEWSLFFLRGVRMPELGPMIAVADVPVSLLTTLLTPISARQDFRVSIESSEGRVLATMPHAEDRLGKQLDRSASVLPPDGKAAIITGRYSGMEVLAAARPTLYPGVVVITGYALAPALTAFRADRQRLLLGAGATGILQLALGSALYAALRQRERVDEERAAARRLLESAIEGMSDGFVMWDADDRLMVCNQRYRDIYAISAPFIVPGIRFGDLVREGAKRGQYPQCGTDIEAFVQETIAWHRADSPPMERLLPDGTWLLVTERRLPQGGTVGIRTDITALKQANAELGATRDAAAAATEAKSRFLARMSHELRTPLNGVLGLAQVLARDPALSGEQRERARTLEKAGRHAVAVADDVLDLAKIESGRFELQEVPTELGPLLRDCLTLFSSAAAEKQIHLDLSLDHSLPKRVATDPTRLRQLLLNLVSNAVKFTPAGGQVALHAERLEADQSADKALIRIDVRDTGPGIPPVMRNAIFSDFVQIDPSLGGGTGLGLAIAAGIVQQMAGRIGCQPVEDGAGPGGTIFWVELPMRPLPEEPMPAALPKDTVPTGPLRVLVVDDVPANLAVARALLESAGHAVTCANDGRAAIAALDAAASGGHGFDAVLMDVMMPGMDGLEAARHIRALPGPERATPILAVTASAFAEDIAACRAAGMDAHLAKPIERDALLGALERLVRPTSAQAPLTPLLTRGGSSALVVPGMDAKATAALAAAFVAEIRAATAALADAADAEDVVRAAHRLAGAAATLGAARLMEAARLLQQDMRRLDARDVPARQAALLDIAEDTLALLAEDYPTDAAA